jgi:hypothetical protein
VLEELLRQPLGERLHADPVKGAKP